MLRSGKRERESTALDKTRKEVRHAHYILYNHCTVLYTSIYECVARLTIICISIERPGSSSKNIKWQEICTAGEVLVRFFSTSPLIVAKFRVQDTLLLNSMYLLLEAWSASSNLQFLLTLTRFSTYTPNVTNWATSFIIYIFALQVTHFLVKCSFKTQTARAI